jgi:hypothetical protein
MPPLCRGKVARKGSPTQGEEIGAGRHRGKQDVCQPGRLTRETARLPPVEPPIIRQWFRIRTASPSSPTLE